MRTQTISQKFRTHYDSVITREQIAGALEEIAKMLREPFKENPERNLQFGSSTLCTYIIAGEGHLLNPEQGRITLHITDLIPFQKDIGENTLSDIKDAS